MNVTDKNLLLACEQGNISGQKLVFEKYAGKILGICNRYFEIEKANKIIENVFFEAFEKLKSNIKTDINLFLFLRAIALEKIKEEILKYKFNSYKEEPVANNLEGDFKIGVDANRLCEIIQELDTTKRFILNLYMIEGYSFSQVANLLHLKEGDVKRIYSIAKREVMEKSVEVLA